MKIVIYVDMKTEEIFYYIVEDGIEPFFVKPRKSMDEASDIEGDDESIH